MHALWTMALRKGTAHGLQSWNWQASKRGASDGSRLSQPHISLFKLLMLAIISFGQCTLCLFPVHISVVPRTKCAALSIAGALARLLLVLECVG